MAFAQNIYHIRYLKREISFEVSTFGGLLLFFFLGGGDRYFWDLLTPVTFIATFRSLLLLRGRYFLNFKVNIQWGLGFAGSLPDPLGQLLQQQDDQYVWKTCSSHCMVFAFDTVLDISSCWHVKITLDSNTHDRMYKPVNSLVHSRASSIFTKEVIWLERKESDTFLCNYCKFAHLILIKITKGT